MDKHGNSHRSSSRFGETPSGNRRPTGSYRSQPSGSYKSRPGYESHSRTAANDSYPVRVQERPNRRSPEQRKAFKRRHRRKRLRLLALILVLILIIAGVTAAIISNRNKVVHQMPTVQRTAEFKNVTITEDT